MQAISRIITIVVSFLLLDSVSGQLCQGSLGDPIVNITFGAGANSGPALAPGKTTSQYVSIECPNDGEYTIRSSSYSCFDDTWHSLVGDHTGDGSGYFMLVNASYQPSVFYLDTVRGLCGNTTYEFAAWIMNVLKSGSCNGGGLTPNLTFKLEKTDGTVLQTYETNNIPATSSPTWRQFGFYFATPPGIFDVVLRIYNNAPGGCGNDLALDDITFRPCGPLISTTVNNEPIRDYVVCEGTTAKYVFNSTLSAGFNNPVFQWEQSINDGPWISIPGATTTTHIQDFPLGLPYGPYRYRMSVSERDNLASQCRIFSKTILIITAPNPVVTLRSNNPICEADDLTIKVTGAAKIDFIYPGGGNGTANGGTNPTDFASIFVPAIKQTDAGAYQIRSFTALGCFRDDVVTIAVNPKPVATVAADVIQICEGGTAQLSGAGGDSYHWIPAVRLSDANSQFPIVSPLDTISYAMIATTIYGCKDTAELIVNVVEKPRVNAGPDRTILEGGSTLLKASSTGQDLSYAWTPLLYLNNPNLLQPTASPLADADYVVTAVSNLGCGQASDKMHVFVYKDVFIPTAFTPNNDGLNDTWNIPILDAFPDAEVSIFNRYGQLVYHSIGNFKPWDGKFNGVQQASGVFVYVIDLKFGFPLKKGTFILIR